MRKAWSFVWLVVAISIAAFIISQMIKPFLGLIAIVLFLSLLAFVGIKVYRHFRKGRRYF